MWQHELKQAGLSRTSPLSSYRGLDLNRLSCFWSGCSAELQEGGWKSQSQFCGPRRLPAPLVRGLASRGGRAGCGMERGRGAKLRASSGHGRGCSAAGTGGWAARPRSPLPADVPAQAGKPFHSSAAKRAALVAAVNQPRFLDSSFILLGPIKNNPCAVGCQRRGRVRRAQLFPCGAGSQGWRRARGCQSPGLRLPAPQPLC